MIDWRSGSNMFTKDECLLALKGLRALERAENFEKWGGQVAPQIKCDVMERVINVYFKKKKPKYKKIGNNDRPYCGKCGLRLKKTWIVCPRCGTRIDLESIYE